MNIQRTVFYLVFGGIAALLLVVWIGSMPGLDYLLNWVWKVLVLVALFNISVKLRAPK